MSEPRYTFLWWGDGYVIYDGDNYIGKDDQVDLIDMLVEAGVVTKLNAEAHFEAADALDNLSDYDPGSFEPA